MVEIPVLFLYSLNPARRIPLDKRLIRCEFQSSNWPGQIVYGCRHPTDPELKQLRLAVDADPTNLHLRFKLGEALCLRQKYQAAVPELCHGTRAPSVRLAAMKLLVEAFDATHLHAMAVRMREKLARESGEEGDSGSAPVPVPTRPVSPPDLSCARERPPKDDAV